MLMARRPSSIKLYTTYTSRWQNFCSARDWDCIYATIQQGLIFLQSLLESGTGYSVLNTARSSLSAIIILPNGKSFGSDPAVVLFMKGVFNIKPTRPRYVTTWDPTQVLAFLETWSTADTISLEKLTLKLLVLILLITGQRPQILPNLNLSNMKVGSNFYEFILNALDLKQGRPNFKPVTILLRSYPANKKLCVVHYLGVYLQRTALIRKGQQQLLLSYKKPHAKASSNTISRWIRQVLTAAGIDVATFSAGSTRAASTSKAREQGAPVSQILAMGGWTQENTFNKFYNRPIQPTPFADRLLNCVDHT
jgi:integrase